MRKLVDDFEGDVSRVNAQLDTSGFNMGQRLVDEFLARTPNLRACTNFTATLHAVASGLRLFLDIPATVATPNPRTGVLSFYRNPLAEFATIPNHLRGLQFSQLLCGAIRGALAAVNIRVACSFERDMLMGLPSSSIRVVLEEHQPEEYPFGDDE